MTEKESKEGLGEGLGISGFTLGVLSIVFAGWMGILVAVIGGIFCLSQKKKKETKMAKVGLILNIIGLIVSILFIVLYATVLAPLIGQLTA